MGKARTHVQLMFDDDRTVTGNSTMWPWMTRLVFWLSKKSVLPTILLVDPQTGEQQRIEPGTIRNAVVAPINGAR